MCLVMIAAGGMVTSMEAGDAVPDWPLSYGSLMPPMVGNVFWEHGHRLVGMALGFATIILTITIAYKEPRKWVRTLAYIALPAVCLQGLMGGFRVKLISSPAVQNFLFSDPTGEQVESFRVAVMMFHTTTAQCLLCLFVVIALVLSRHWVPTATSIEDIFCRACGYNLRGSPAAVRGGGGCPECGMQGSAGAIPKVLVRLPRLALITAITILIQLLLGAYRRHTDCTIIYHAIGAFVVAVHVIALSRKVLIHCAPRRIMTHLAITLLVALAAQLALGVGSWILKIGAIESGQLAQIGGKTEYASALISLHVAVGAIMLAVCVMLIVEARRLVGGGTESPACVDPTAGSGPGHGGKSEGEVVTA